MKEALINRVDFCPSTIRAHMTVPTYNNFSTMDFISILFEY